MRIFFGTVLRERRRSRRRSLAGALDARKHGRRPRLPDGRSEDGFLLIEVLISTLLVGMIVIATFNGFDAATRASGDQRRHNEAALLAAQSQEQLRSDPATALDALESTPRSYTKEVQGTVYTIIQEAKAVSASGNSTGCNASSKSNENGANIQISSSVTWPQLKLAGGGERLAVKQASVITPPTGSALEVDVTNEAAPPEGQSGVTAVAKFLPSGSATYTTAEGTTGPAGCVVLTGLATTLATVEIAEKLYFVTTSGKLKYPNKEVTIAPNVTTQYPVAYATGGRITATFTYKGEESWEGQKVKGDTFVASNSHIPAGNVNYEVGSTVFGEYKGSEEQYKALTGTYSQKASTAAATKYLRGDLFPFAAPWTLYAGDCPANNVGKEAESSEEAVVEEGGTIVRKVPTSYTKLTAWAGPDNKSSVIRGEAEKERLGPVKITNSECASSEMPDNSYEHLYTHEQTETLPEGRLENPFQPFGAFSLCLVDKKTEKTYTVKYTNSKVEGSTPQIYLGQKTATQQLEQRTAELAAKTKLEKEETEAITAKEKRVKEEAEVKTAKEKREKEEKEATIAREKRETEEKAAIAAREKREAEEKTEREKWEKEEKEGKISNFTRKNRETTQTNTRKTDEAAEKTAREKREKEETEAIKAKEKRVKEEAEVGPAKEKREAEEAAAKAPKEARENALKEATAKEEVRKKEEEAEAATGVLVEKKASC